MTHNRPCLRSALSLFSGAWRRGDQLSRDQRGHEGAVEESIGVATEGRGVSMYTEMGGFRGDTGMRKRAW